MQVGNDEYVQIGQKQRAGWIAQSRNVTHLRMGQIIGLSTSPHRSFHCIAS